MKLIKFRKNILIYILTLFILSHCVFNVSAVENPYPTSQTIDGVTTIPCTWYAWQQAYDNTGVSLPNFGDAINWYSRAESSGYAVGLVAKPKSIAVWSGGSYGHVSYVISVNGSKMTVNEGGMNSGNGGAYNGNGIYNGNVVNSIVGQQKGNGSTKILIGFIYLTETPSTPSVSIYTDYSKDTITDTNAILYGRVDKPSNYAVDKIGIKVRQEGSSYENGWSRYDTPSSSYTGYTYMYPYYDMTAELGATLTHATTYYYQFYAMVNGTEYWSAENTFTTTGSHSYPSDWTTVTNATCTSEGSSQRSCAGCGKTETQVIPALGHNYASYWTTDQDATCTVSGSKSHHCYNCSSKSDITVIPATGHSYSEWIVEREASIKYIGIKKHYCQNCDATETLYLPTLSYKLGDYNFDNKVDTTDLAKFKTELTLLGLLEKEYGDSDIAIFEDESLLVSTNDLFIVCDLNEDGDINTTDLAFLKLTLAGMMDIENRGGTLIMPNI